MKLPRGVSGDRLLRALRQAGYTIVRQKGSHVRLQHPGPPDTSITKKSPGLRLIPAEEVSMKVPPELIGTVVVKE